MQLDYPRSTGDFTQMLALQRENLEMTLGPNGLDQGFVTVQHDLATLREMNEVGRHAIARQAGKVIGYALCMPLEFGDRIPVLAPMFELFNNVKFLDKKTEKQHALALLRYFVMGQVCIAKGWRGQGIFDGLYQQLRKLHGDDYEAVVTEVASRNVRSIRAHLRVGFETIRQYEAPLNPSNAEGAMEQWEIMLWDWR